MNLPDPNQPLLRDIHERMIDDYAEGPAPEVVDVDNVPPWVDDHQDMLDSDLEDDR